MDNRILRLIGLTKPLSREAFPRLRGHPSHNNEAQLRSQKNVLILIIRLFFCESPTKYIIMLSGKCIINPMDMHLMERKIIQSELKYLTKRNACGKLMQIFQEFG